MRGGAGDRRGAAGNVLVCGGDDVVGDCVARERVSRHRGRSSNGVFVSAPPLSTYVWLFRGCVPGYSTTTKTPKGMTRVVERKDVENIKRNRPVHSATQPDTQAQRSAMRCAAVSAGLNKIGENSPRSDLLYTGTVPKEPARKRQGDSIVRDFAIRETNLPWAA